MSVAFPHGSEPLLAATRLSEARARIEDVPLSPNARRAVEAGIALIEARWNTRKQENYNNSLAQRDKQYADVVQVAQDACKAAKKVLDDLGDGRKSAREARAWLRSTLGYHQQLSEQFAAVIETDDSLAEFETMSVDEFQAQQVDRLPSVYRNEPTVRQEASEFISQENFRAFKRKFAAEGPMGIDASQLTHPDGAQT